jgi:predicted DNA-binding ribbon-helix-helix protein
MKTNNFALRLPDSLYAGLKEAAAADNVAMNQYLTIALAEKLSARATAAEFFSNRASKGNLSRAMKILEKSGSDIAEEDAVRELQKPVRRRKLPAA